MTIHRDPPSDPLTTVATFVIGILSAAKVFAMVVGL